MQALDAAMGAISLSNLAMPTSCASSTCSKIDALAPTMLASGAPL